MLSVQLWNCDGDEAHLGSWYSEEGVQVPREGDVVWIETDKIKHDRWRVVQVQWSFRDTTHGIGHTRMMIVEVWVKAYSTKPLWRRFVELLPGQA